MANRRTALILTMVLVLLLLLVPKAYSSEPNENEELYEFLSSESQASARLFDFLSDVVELDLTKYGVVPPEVVPPGFEGLSPLEFYKQMSEYVSTLPPSNFTLDDQFGGLVEEESPSFDFAYNNSTFDAMAIVYNGHMNYLDVDSYSEEDYVYSEPQPADTFGRAKAILQRYQTFFQTTYGKDAPYLVPMLDILNSVGDLSPTEFTEGNITFQVSEDGNQTRIKWIYTEDDVVMDRKLVEIEFRYGAFESFTDTWGLYSVSGLSEITSEEAFQIAFEAAQNYDFIVTDENDDIVPRKVPDLSNAFHQDYFSMVPFRFLDYNFPSEMERDPLTLYPFWQFRFYFNETILGYDGMQVGVWGDTSELVYCSGFGHYGTLVPAEGQEITTTSQPSDEQSSEEPTQAPQDDLSLGEPDEQSTEEPPNILNPLTLAVVASLVAVPVISISAFALLRKKGNNLQS